MEKGEKDSVQLPSFSDEVCILIIQQLDEWDVTQFYLSSFTALLTVKKGGSTW